MLVALALSPAALLLCAQRAAAEPLPDAQRRDVQFHALPCPDAPCRPVEYHDYRVGTGAVVRPGSVVVLKWTGRLADRYGWPIQNENADEITVTVGTDALISGFEMALMGMRQGGKRRMLIPAQFGYLDQRSGPLPASYGDRRRLFATVLNQRRFKRAGDLVIDVQLLKVRNAQQ
ncbi:unnamed protein product [Agarophyton chilense]